MILREDGQAEPSLGPHLQTFHQSVGKLDGLVGPINFILTTELLCRRFLKGCRQSVQTGVQLLQQQLKSQRSNSDLEIITTAKRLFGTWDYSLRKQVYITFLFV